jgi:FkbM family methyltransferase
MHDQILQKISEHVSIRGIVQVGANTGQECELFRRYTSNFICFEPLPGPFQKLQSVNPDIKCYNFALGEINEIKSMNIASNNGESSSFLKPINHIHEFPNIHFILKSDFEIKRFDSLDISLEGFNVLISDTQGYEINVLKGFGKMIESFDFIMTEYIDSNMYANDSKQIDIANYLKDYGFEVCQVYPESSGTWGNILFKKQKNKI